MRWYGSIGHRRPSSGVSSSVRDASFATPATPAPPPPLAATTRAAFYLFGVVANIPWNALILSLPYLLDRLDGSPLQPYLGSSMVVTFNVAGLGALMVATWLADKVHCWVYSPWAYLISVLSYLASTQPQYRIVCLHHSPRALRSRYHSPMANLDPILDCACGYIGAGVGQIFLQDTCRFGCDNIWAGCTRIVPLRNRIGRGYH